MKHGLIEFILLTAALGFLAAGHQLMQIQSDAALWTGAACGAEALFLLLGYAIVAYRSKTE